MCWGWTQDWTLLSQLLKTESSIHPPDSPGLQGMKDQSPDPGPAPLAEGLRDEPLKDSHPEEDCVPRSTTDEE